MKEKLLNWLNTALVADFFVVLFAFFWLAIAVVGHTLHIPLGLSIWYKLWQPVFTPAIGILMGGTIISGIASRIAKYRSQQAKS